MLAKITVGDCVRVPGGRLGRVRARVAAGWRVRVRRHSGTSNEFLVLLPSQMRRIPTPKGWMTPIGYRRYLKATLARLRLRRLAP